MLERTTKINMLYDFYHPLLTDKQKSYMEMYYEEDYSLGEIAELTEVSRQAVYDTIKRTEQLLMTYEEKLSLYTKYLQREAIIENMTALFTEEKNEAALTMIRQMQNID